MDTIGTRIKQARLSKGMTQAELANRLGVAYQNIGQWESGKRIPKMKNLVKISEALDVPWIWFTRPDIFDDNLKSAQNEYKLAVSQSKASEAFFAVLAGAYEKSTERIVTGKYRDERYWIYDNWGEPFALMENDIDIIAEAVYSVMNTLVERLSITEREAEEQAQNLQKEHDEFMAAEQQNNTSEAEE
ncbi:MAG TPA: helix-turn-helix domain-containing protein [Candidatus Anaerofilum faecale]|nr:helix-turn-helix domain-containing protein [Candidatus Anaerofilum faecale]